MEIFCLQKQEKAEKKKYMTKKRTKDVYRRPSPQNIDMDHREQQVLQYRVNIQTNQNKSATGEEGMDDLNKE